VSISMKQRYVLTIILILLLVPGVKFFRLYEDYHTKIETTPELRLLKPTKEEKYILFPEFTVVTKKLGIEDVISSIIIIRKGDHEKTIVKSYKLKEGDKTIINSTKIPLDNYDSINWVINLYGKHSLTSIAKIELFNKTYKLR